jgi:tRNA nucleotidyltransferase (CCA-adding enzyme)
MLARPRYRGAKGEDLPVQIPPAPELLELIRALPAGRPLLRGLGEAPRTYLVGGAVRDLLLGGRPRDLDLVVEGSAAEEASRIGKDPVVHDRFGTSTVTIDGFSYDVAQARRETYSQPGALPDVEPAGIDEDLLRRDFTVNAIAVPLGGPAAGSVKAPPGAIEDLDARVLRALHDRSFVDDPTRLLRLIRYSSRLGFGIEPGTRELADAAIAAGALDTVSGPRIGAELRLLAREQDPVGALVRLGELGVDRAIHSLFGLEDERLAAAALALLPEDGRRDRLALALAARGLPVGELAALLDRLAFDAPDRDAIGSAAQRSEALAQALGRVERPSQTARAVGGASAETVALAGALGPEQEAREWLGRLRHVGLEIDGRDLIAEGVPEGPAIGRGLDAALAAKLDGRADGREAELAAALEAARSRG